MYNLYLLSIISHFVEIFFIFLRYFFHFSNFLRPIFSFLFSGSTRGSHCYENIRARIAKNNETTKKRIPGVSSAPRLEFSTSRKTSSYIFDLFRAFFLSFFCKFPHFHFSVVYLSYPFKIHIQFFLYYIRCVLSFFFWK